MLNNVMIGRYYNIKSKVHLMNSLAKIICTLIFITATLISNDIRIFIILFFLLMLMIFTTKIPLSIYLKAIKSMQLLLLFVLIISLIFGSSIEFITISLLRIIYVVLYTSILTLTTAPTEITYGLERLFSPLRILRIPVNKMALAITLALRFIPTIIDQANKILKSQASRGVDFYNSNLKGKFLALKSLIIPMFILSFKRADALADAMEVRLYNINKKRTNFRQNNWGVFDTYLVLIHSLILVIIVKGV